LKIERKLLLTAYVKSNTGFLVRLAFLVRPGNRSPTATNVVVVVVVVVDNILHQAAVADISFRP